MILGRRIIPVPPTPGGIMLFRVDPPYSYRPRTGFSQCNPSFEVSLALSGPIRIVSFNNPRLFGPGSEEALVQGNVAGSRRRSCCSVRRTLGLPWKPGREE